MSERKRRLAQITHPTSLFVRGVFRSARECLLCKQRRIRVVLVEFHHMYSFNKTQRVIINPLTSHVW